MQPFIRFLEHKHMRYKFAFLFLNSCSKANQEFDGYI